MGGLDREEDEGEEGGEGGKGEGGERLLLPLLN